MRSTITACRGCSSSPVPPRTASSAETPSAAPRWLTMSMNGPGKVFSRPTRTPTILFSPIAPISQLPASGGEVLAHHFRPVGPIVSPSGPNIEPDVDPFRFEEVRDLHRLLDVGIVGAGRDHLRSLSPQRVEVGGVTEAGEEGQQVGEGGALVVESVQPARGVVRAAQRDVTADPA